MEDNKVVHANFPKHGIEDTAKEIRDLQEQLNNAIIRAKKRYRLDSTIVINNTKNQIDAIVITKSY